MIVKRVLCLANSRKLTGRCVAGVVIDKDLEWIRPVSDREHEEVSERERQYEDGSDPQVLDIIDIPLLRHVPRDFQQENWLLDPEYYWAKVGKSTPKELGPYCQQQGALWTNGEHTYHGLNDAIPIDVAEQLRFSLTLIRVDSIALRVYVPGAAFGDSKRRVQAQFTFDDREYHLRVTDPKLEREYLAKENGLYERGPAFLTVSLGEPFQGRTYKLVAAVIPITGEAGQS